MSYHTSLKTFCTTVHTCVRLVAHCIFTNITCSFTHDCRYFVTLCIFYLLFLYLSTSLQKPLITAFGEGQMIHSGQLVRSSIHFNVLLTAKIILRRRGGVGEV